MSRYAAPPLSFPQVDLGLIPKGYLGTKTTLHHIQDLIRAGAKDFYVRQKAIDILLAKGIRPKDYLGEIKALFEWVQRNVRYTKDPFRVEVLHAARRLLELRAGDCDDMTIVLGSMLEAIGHPVRLVVTGPDPLRPKLFSHIYLEAFHQGRWIPLDATMPYPMGWQPRTLVKEVIPIERNTVMMPHPQGTELQGAPYGFAAVPPPELPSLLQSIRQGSVPPKDPRVKSLWLRLRQSKRLHRSRWLRSFLKFMWQQGLSARPRPGLAQRLEQLMQRWGLLPLQSAAQSTPRSTPQRTVAPKPVSLRSVAMRPVPGVRVKPLAQVPRR